MPGSWSPPTWLLVLAIIAWAAAQYGLAYWTLRDLRRRPRVRGGNKVLWALVILTFPVAGALVYATIGPTSFLPRQPRSTTAGGSTRGREPPRRQAGKRG